MDKRSSTRTKDVVLESYKVLQRARVGLDFSPYFIGHFSGRVEQSVSRVRVCVFGR